MWPRFDPPLTQWLLTVADVALASNAIEHVEGVRAWSGVVWAGWQHMHATIASLVASTLVIAKRGGSPCENLVMEAFGTALQVKAESERIIQAGRWDPCRPSEEVAAGALVMNALIQIYFGAPIQVIDRWIASNNLRSSLSRRERKLLASVDRQLTEQERIDLYWYVESLWALVWAGGLAPDLAIAHWYARDGQLNRYDTGVFDLDIIMERRKALEWCAIGN